MSALVIDFPDIRFSSLAGVISATFLFPAEAHAPDSSAAMTIAHALPDEVPGSGWSHGMRLG
ncbi:hypothetical protein BKK80_27370 [Cupriavidus malaysiensis]|uniref:Uncharacterized protein n=1 Tax=Cupriavidus malaysiensis TaxID=367825 RepID=A0ABN4TQV9_9BURK|nr:hypothetical protein BKK80_27370 [Cupriavidus malaysiensis]